MSRITNMTAGNPTKLILTVAFPMIITNLGQQMYNIVDTAIVGRGIGVSALASVGCTTWIYGIILWSILAITAGLSTFIARYFGMGNKEMLNRSLAMSILISLIIAIAFTVIGLWATRPILELLKTPDDIIDGAATYLYVMIAGTLPVMGYNLTSSILRAFGDGKTPLIAMIIAALLNIGLDILLVIVIPLGIFGAAIATVISQIFSFIYCVFEIKKIEYIELKKEYWKRDGVIVKQLLLFCLPLGFQNAILAVGGLVLQSAVNLEGSIFIAGYTATNRLYGMFECTAIALGYAILTYVSQNFGLGDIKRVKEGFKKSFFILVVFALIVMVVMMLTGRLLLSLFIDAEEISAKQSLDIAFKYLFIMLCANVVLYLIYLYRCTLQGLGNSFWSMLSGVGEFSARVFFALVLYRIWGAEVIYFVEVAAWLAALIIVIIPCHIKLGKMKGNENGKNELPSKN